MPKSIQSIVYEFTKELRGVLSDNLTKVILYGSYARGDYRSNSDVDIMILVKLNDHEIEEYLDAISDLAFDFFLKYDVDISPVVKNEEHFNYWVETLPFYRNVRDEGVVLNG